MNNSIKFYFLAAFAQVVIAVLLYFFVTGDYKKKTEGDNVLLKRIDEINLRIDSLNSLVTSKSDSIKTIETSKIYYKSYYETKIYEIDSIYNDSDAVNYLRQQLERLLPARFN